MMTFEELGICVAVVYCDGNDCIQYLQTPMRGEGTTDLSCCCCCITGNVRAIFRINKRGFVPGENILVFAQVHNESNTTVSQTKVALKQVSIAMCEISSGHQLGVY